MSTPTSRLPPANRSSSIHELGTPHVAKMYPAQAVECQNNYIAIMLKLTSSRMPPSDRIGNHDGETEGPPSPLLLYIRSMVMLTINKEIVHLTCCQVRSICYQSYISCCTIISFDSDTRDTHVLFMRDNAENAYPSDVPQCVDSLKSHIAA